MTSAEMAQRDRLVLEHVPLVKAIAARVHESLPLRVELDDLVHSGIMGLFDAADKFKPEKRVLFSSYAKHRIKGAMIDDLRKLDAVSRDSRRKDKRVENAVLALRARLLREPTEIEMAQELGMELADWREFALGLGQQSPVSSSSYLDGQLPPPDPPCARSLWPDAIYESAELSGKLSAAIRSLPARYQKVIKLYYTVELTMRSIGLIMRINESRVSQIHRKALDLMVVALRAHGIVSASQAHG